VPLKVGYLGNSPLAEMSKKLQVTSYTFYYSDANVSESPAACLRRDSVSVSQSVSEYCNYAFPFDDLHQLCMTFVLSGYIQLLFTLISLGATTAL
jgi:hypothetical protein